MNKRNIAYQDANLRVVAVFDDYPDEVAKNTSLATHVSEFRVLVKGITDLEVDVEGIGDVTAIRKSQARTQLENVCLQQSKQMYVFAEETKNYPLLDFLEVTHSGYSQMRTAKLSAYAQAQLKETLTYAAELGEVGIAEEQIAELTAASDAFVQLMEDPRQQINQRKKKLESIHTKVDKTRDMLSKVFDFLIASYPSDSPFVQDYQLARIVVEPATHHRADADEVEQ